MPTHLKQNGSGLCSKFEWRLRSSELASGAKTKKNGSYFISPPERGQAGRAERALFQM